MKYHFIIVVSRLFPDHRKGQNNSYYLSAVTIAVSENQSSVKLLTMTPVAHL